MEEFVYRWMNSHIHSGKWTGRGPIWEICKGLQIVIPWHKSCSSGGTVHMANCLWNTPQNGQYVYRQAVLVGPAPSRLYVNNLFPHSGFQNIKFHSNTIYVFIVSLLFTTSLPSCWLFVSLDITRFLVMYSAIRQHNYADKNILAQVENCVDLR
jgi:hypothetical protein